MMNKYNYNDSADEQYYGECLTEYYSECLSEIDFYPPTDNRTLKSNVVDIAGGDNFADYCKCIFDLLEEDGYYD